MCPIHQVAVVQYTLGHCLSYSIFFECFSLESIQFSNQVKSFLEGDCGIGFIWSEPV